MASGFMVLVNGMLGDSVSVYDRGLAYGDGVFRTLRIQRGAAMHWERHYRKLKADCDALGIHCPAESSLKEDVNQLAAAHPESIGKIIITRGEGQRGYAVDGAAPPTRIVMTSPVPEYPQSYSESGVKIRQCETRLALQPRLAGVKHLNRLENVMARKEWSDSGIPEGLLLDTEGHVIEGTMTNLFMVKGGTMFTPDLSRCGVAGVQRERILETAAAKGMAVGIETFLLDFLLQADEVFLVNSVIGVWQVREILNVGAPRKTHGWGKGALTPIIRQWLNDGQA